MENFRAWSDLPFDLLVRIATSVQCIKDFFAFRAVCVSWRSAGAKENFDETRQLPWLLNEHIVENEKSKFALSSLSEVLGCAHSPAEVYAPVVSSTKVGTYCQAWRGWLLVVEENEVMYLLHVLTQTRINLPPISSLKQFYEYDEPITVHKVLISASPLTTHDYTVMILYSWFYYIAFWRPGDISFTDMKISLTSDVIFYNGMFYSINMCGSPRIYDISKPHGLNYIMVPNVPDVGGMISENRVRKIMAMPTNYHLVESGGELLVVVQMHDFCMLTEKWRLPERFYVYALCESNKWREIKDLGDRALFVGSSSFSVDTSQIQGCRKNCIYFIRNLEMPVRPQYYEKLYDYQVGIYNLTDERTECSCERKGLPLWLMPSFH